MLSEKNITLNLSYLGVTPVALRHPCYSRPVCPLWGFLDKINLYLKPEFVYLKVLANVLLNSQSVRENRFLLYTADSAGEKKRENFERRNFTF